MVFACMMLLAVPPVATSKELQRHHINGPVFNFFKTVDAQLMESQVPNSIEIIELNCVTYKIKATTTFL